MAFQLRSRSSVFTSAPYLRAFTSIQSTRRSQANKSPTTCHTPPTTLWCMMHPLSCQPTQFKRELLQPLGDMMLCRAGRAEEHQLCKLHRLHSCCSEGPCRHAPPGGAEPAWHHASGHAALPHRLTGIVRYACRSCDTALHATGVQPSMCGKATVANTSQHAKWSSLVCCATAWPYPVGSVVDLPVAEPGTEKHAQPGRKGGKTVYHAAEVLRVRSVNLRCCTLTQV